MELDEILESVKSEKITTNEAKKLLRLFPGAPHFSMDDGSVKFSLAWLLDHVLSWKDVSHGAVGVFQKQPLVLVNYGNAYAHELHTFAQTMQKDVKNKIEIEIVPEITFIGEF